MKVAYPSLDGLLITADLYKARHAKGCIVLCHRSHFNRGEYKEIAPKLVARGFTCLAIDQRSGMNVLGYINETSTRAKEEGLPTGYLDARQDIEASVDYLYKKNGSKPVVLVGSSYSASLALLVGVTNSMVKAVAAFSPGEYLRKTHVAESTRGLAKPLFVTAAKKEIEAAQAIVRYIDPKNVRFFNPPAQGAHGARALWEFTEGQEAYWQAFERFLSDV